MENQAIQNPTPEPTLTPVQISEPKAKFPVVYLVLSLFILLLLVSTVFLYYQNLQLKNMLASYQTQTAVSPTPATYQSPIPSTTTNPTANWKTYNSPEIGDYISPFQMSYPPTWVIEEKLSSEEPKSLTLTLKNTNNETIEILQGAGGGGNCIYYDDVDYTSYEGAGQFFSSYLQLNKPALWRISQYKEKNKTSHVVCEKTKDRYIDGTRIGWISINIKSEVSLQEVKSILEKIVFKPTSKTKTLFD